MLRITIHDSGASLTFQLEGRLIGPWVAELEKSWRDARAGQPDCRVLIDLTGVSFIDAAGKAFLAAAHRAGAKFLTADCLMCAIVAEVSCPRLAQPNAPTPA
jgi:anti-anti-sigma regulatory factor